MIFALVAIGAVLAFAGWAAFERWRGADQRAAHKAARLRAEEGR